MKAGDILGRYEVISPLARGGMAEVWLARIQGERGFSKTLVLKTILPHLADNAEFERMFVNEALLAARLNHPNVVQILDLGKAEGLNYIVMEYVPGVTLRQLLRAYAARKRLTPPWFLLRTLASTCEGLFHAHELRDDDGSPLHVVHRDVSPENVMISRAGVVKVLDFGVAKATTAATQTNAGVLKGKYSYLAPELIAGRQADARSDLYAVGVMLYEGLAGRRPFSGANDLTLLHAITQAQPTPIQQLVPSVPDDLAALVHRALAREPEARFQTARAMGDALQSFLERGLKDRHTQRHLGELVQLVFPPAEPGEGAKPSTTPSSAGAKVVDPLVVTAPEVAGAGDAPTRAGAPAAGQAARPKPAEPKPAEPKPAEPKPAPPAPLADRHEESGRAAPTGPRAAPLVRFLMPTEAAAKPGFKALLTPSDRDVRRTEEREDAPSDDVRAPEPSPPRPGAARSTGTAPTAAGRGRPSWLVGSREPSGSAVEETSEESTPAWLRRKQDRSLARHLGAPTPLPERLYPPDEPAEDESDPDAAAERHVSWAGVYEREGRFALAIEELGLALRLLPGEPRYTAELARLEGLLAPGAK